jgi:hypothetical protein
LNAESLRDADKRINDADEKIYVWTSNRSFLPNPRENRGRCHFCRRRRKIIAVGPSLHLLFSWPQTRVAISWAWQCGPVTVRTPNRQLGRSLSVSISMRFGGSIAFLDKELKT